VEFDFAQTGVAERRKLLSSSIVPRPIAWVVSMNRDGALNAAPFSFFNLICTDPPLLCVSVTQGAGGRHKDTANNVSATGQFVVNLVPYRMRETMNVCGTDFPPEISEIEMAGARTVPSRQVKPPRIAGCPAAYECRVERILEIGCTLIVGRVVHMYLDDRVVDPKTLYIDTDAMDLIARMHGRGWYLRTTDTFEMPRRQLSEFDAENTSSSE
jgi:flavin reductase (DIM6/NTAB) family NADH-FMN oxidoreductase RutF